MVKPGIPESEDKRLATLYALNLLDTDSEERFDRITRIAKQHFQVPIALVTLIDSERQWFKSKQGIDICESHRDVSFCGHAILQDEIFYIADASKDDRFSDNPFVANPPFIRFYAGAPLRATNGEMIGTLCIIDAHARTFTNEQLSVLRDLADCAEVELNRGNLLLTQFEVFRKNQILQGALVNTPLGAISWDTNFRVISWNRSAERIFGFRAEEALGRNAYDLIIPAGSTNEKVRKIFEQLLQTQGGVRATNNNVTKSGTLITCDWYNTPVSDASGRVVEISSLVQDITEELQIKHDLEASQTRFKNFAEIASDWLWELDKNLRFTFLSEGFHRISGFDSAEMIGKTRWEFSESNASPEESEKWRAHRATLENQQEFHDFQYQKIVKNGSLLTFSVSGRPVFDSSGTFIGYQGTARDVSKNIAAQNELLHAKNAAELASKAKSDFLSSMSHELRTPLNAIIGFSQLMIMDDELTDEYKLYSKDIFNAGKHLQRLVNDVLDLSAIEENQLKLSREHVNIDTTISECIDLLSPAAKAKNIHIESPAKTGQTVFADTLRLKQVFLNLLSNAIKYNKTDGTVKISTEFMTPETIQIQVSDTGKGIAHDQIGNLFMPFNRLGAENSTIEGAGIGLTITKRIVEKMGGAIGAQSQLNVGSVFWVRLPTASAKSSR